MEFIEDKYRVLFENNFLGVVTTNHEFNIVDVNESACNLYGYTKRELEQMSLRDICPPKSADASEKALMSDFVTGKKPHFILEKTYLRKDGTLIDGMTSVTAHYDNDDGHFLGSTAIILDVTEKKKYEHTIESQNKELKIALRRVEEVQLQLVQSEKMALLGELASGIAHEVNTPLGAIKASIKNVEYVLESLSEQLSRKGDNGAFIKSASNFNLRSSFASFSEKNTFKKSVIEHLSKFVTKEEVEEMMFSINIVGDYIQSPELKKIIESVQSKEAFDCLLLELKVFTIKSSFNTVNVSIDKANEIVTALKKNAYVKQEALINKEGNKSDVIDSLRTAIIIQQHHLKRINLDLDFPEEAIFVNFNYSELTQVWNNLLSNAYQALGNQKEGKIGIKVKVDLKQVQVMISDNGEGISDEMQKVIFDLYYTTKPLGKGVGIGLSIVRKSLLDNNGSIRVESKLGIGSTFVITLNR